MKEIIGLTMILAGIVLGVYVGVWVMFIGGIIQVVETIKAEEIDALNVVIGIARFLLAGVVGTISAQLLIIPGMVIARD